MKIKDSVQTGALAPRGIVEKRTESRDARKDGAQKDSVTVDVSRARGIGEALSSEVMNAERSRKVTEIKELLRSGGVDAYFKSRNMNDIAAAVGRGLSEEVDLLKAVAGDE